MSLYAVRLYPEGGESTGGHLERRDLEHIDLVIATATDAVASIAASGAHVSVTIVVEVTR